jgi:hypothetical protein
MATKEQIQSKIDDIISQNERLSTDVNTTTFEAKNAYSAWKSAENASDSGTYIFNGQTFTDKTEYVSAAYSDFKNKDSAARAVRQQFNDNVAEQNQLKEQLAAATDETVTLKDTEGTTNESQSDKTTAAAYDDPSQTPGVQTFDDGSTLQTFDDGSTLATDTDGESSSSESTDNSRLDNLTDSNSRSISFGAQTNSSAGATAQWAGTKDLRTVLRVPSSYLTGLAAGPQSILKNFGGILFPYTPSISYDNQATYTAISPTHSNYTQFFFKNSNVGPITVTGKFTVQNESEAEIWLSVQHLLRSLTKMRFGTDANAGAPPPVCRLDAYGDMMLSNVPVVVASFKIEYPDSVDYIAVKKGQYASSLVPTISTLSLTLNLMYSRKEIRDFSVDQWLSGKLSNKGYL